MHKRTTALILSGVLVTGAVGAVAITPASATSSDNVVTSRLASIKSALSGLVSDGTLTQKQADKVAGTLDSTMPKRALGGHKGGRGMGLGMGETQDAAAKALGMTTAKLRAALRSGKSLADVAKDQKVSVDSLVKAMVAGAQGKLAAAVKDGKITQARADTIKSALTQRITARVKAVRPVRGPGHSQRGSETSPSTGNVPGGAPSTSSRTI
jgi:hypothetical protein